MLIDKDIRIHLSCQQFECNRFDIGEDRSVLLVRSSQGIDEVVCPFCGGSGIPTLERFARLKEKRLDGSVALARHSISTGRLEGSTTRSRWPRGSATATATRTTSSPL